VPIVNTAPPAPVHAVDRPELRERLDGALGAPLTLIVAPAGSGKTVLLSQWVASRPDLHVVWIDVEPVDDEPTQFAKHLLDGLATIAPTAPSLGHVLSVGGGGLGRSFLESLETLLTEHPGVVLVFDDLHNLRNREIINDLWWFAEHLPHGAHIVFSSRRDLRLALSRQRLQYALLELRQAELAFDADVAGKVLLRIAGAPPTDAMLSSIMHSTEGWAAGIQLTAISLRHHDDPELFARQLAGTDRLIAEYLSEEVLGAQSEERREVLLRLSALDRMSPSLVEAVLGIDDATILFEELERDSMFLVPIDHRHEWFRFHHLFRDLLRYRLRARHPDDEVRILTTAADWHIANGNAGAAIDCLVHGRVWDRALDLVLTRGRDVFERGQTVAVARWLSAVPDAYREARPEAESLLGMVLGMSGQAAAGEDVFRRLITRTDLSSGIRLVVQSYLAARVQFRSEVSVSLDEAREALRLLRENPGVKPPDLLGLTDRSLLHTLALGSRGRAHFLAGELTESRRWLTEALESPGAQYSAYRVHLVGSMALLEAWCGRLEVAQALADEGLELARGVGLLIHPAPADAYLALALSAVHRGRPQGGAFALYEGGVRAGSNHRTQLMWVARLARVLSGGAPETGAESAGSPPPIVQDALRAATHRAHRLSGEAVAAAQEPPAWSAQFVEGVAHALTARRPDRARAMLDAAAFAARGDRPMAAVEHGILSSWLAHIEGRSSDSRRRLAAAVDLAAEYGLVSPFLWAGPHVIRLVGNLPVTYTPFRRELLDRAQEHFRPSVADRELAEALTERERELLAYLPSRLTNAELAERFFVSVNTIKTHTAHIYRKLDSPNRSAAVARATELGLL